MANSRKSINMYKKFTYFYVINNYLIFHPMKNVFKIVLLFVTVLTFSKINAQKVCSTEGHKACCSSTKTLKAIQQTPLLHHYDVKFYHLDIAVERTSIDIEGQVSILAQVTTPVLDTFAFELINALGIDSVLINGINSTFTRTGDEVFVKVLPGIAQGNMVEARIFYGGTPSSGGFFSGISNAQSPTWGNRITWTLSEPFNARQWFPCKQVLPDKADSVYVFITTSDENKAGSNGLLENIVPLPGNKVRYEWKSRYPINYYLISIAVGKYVDYSFYAHPAGLNDSILIQNYIYDNPQTLPYFKTQIDLTDDFIELFSDLYGLYPFWQEKYGHCMAPLNGGMEHQTMTTQGTFTFTLTSHELGHQWFGNNVTCATWSDIWINEGFASYSEYLALENLNSPNHITWMKDAHNTITGEPGGSVFVPVNQANDENRIFNGRLSYKKGAAILHMLRIELQDDVMFFDILKAFQIQFKDSVATGDDFKELTENMSGKNFDYFFDQWYYGEGHPIYDIVWLPFNDTLFISSTQTPSTFTAGVFDMLLPFSVYSPAGDTTFWVRQDEAMETFALYFPHQIDSIKFDPDHHMLKVLSNMVQGQQEAKLSLQNFLAMPNPANDAVTLQFATPENRHISIFSSTGSLVQEIISSETVLHLNISHLAPGLYLIKANGNKELFEAVRLLKL